MRFLFCSMSIRGMLHASIGIARALRERGHEIAFATGPTMSSILDGAGFQRIPRGERDGRSFDVQRPGNPIEILRQVRHINYALEQFPADVLVGQQLTLGPLVAAEIHALPVALIGLAAHIWPKQSADEPDKSPDVVAATRMRHRAFLHSLELSRMMAGLGEAAWKPSKLKLLGDLFLLRSVPELEGGGLPERVECVGDCLWGESQKDEQTMRWIDAACIAGEPVLYAQPGRLFQRIPDFWNKLVIALGDRPIRVAASVGRLDDVVTRVPDNFLVRSHIPQELILPHAQGVISTSTTTAVLGALCHGVPLLLFQGGGNGEQGELAWRCIKQGVALYKMAENVTVSSIRQSVDELIHSQAMQTRARSLKDAFARSGGPGHAAELLESLDRGTASACYAAHSGWQPRIRCSAH